MLCSYSSMIEFDPNAPIFAEADLQRADQCREEAEVCARNVGNEKLVVPAQTFVTNMDAIFSMLALPGHAAAYGAGFGAGDIVEFASVHFSEETRFPEELKRAVDARHEEGAMRYPSAASFLNDRESMEPAIRAYLSFTVVALWTALESLAKDMWMASVNLSADRLAKSALNADASIRGSEAKSVKSSWLAKYRFDLRNHMGTLLVEDEGKFSFDSPSQILEAYAAAFGKSSPVDELWQDNKRDLNLLNLCRNLVAHRAGIVDERFISKTKLNLPIGTPLLVNTENVTQFAETVVEAGCELLSFVGKWFDENLGNSSQVF